MCTVVVSLAPEDQVPLFLLGIRDEFTGRPWQPPARHWPGSPLIGGRDEQAGGTWLAVHPELPRVACVLNGRGEAAPASRRRSRGDLPLRAAQQGPQALADLHADAEALATYDPFYLVCADRTTVVLLSWDGRRATLSDLWPATHLLTNTGRMYPPARPGRAAPGQAQAAPDPKATRFGPKFAARRPSGDPAATIKDAWGDWLTLAVPDQSPAQGSPDPGAIIVRQELPDGRVWGSTSVSLVALARDGRLRYDFQPDPANPATWYSVATDAVTAGAAAGRAWRRSARCPGRTSSG
jgi:hypothetical protein